jgi:hypothetical protein
MQSEYDADTKTLTFRFAGRLLAEDTLEMEREVMARLDALCGGDAPLPASDIHVVFDMAKVRYVASAFLRVCIVTGKRVGQGKMTVANARPQIRQVFAVTQLDSLIRVV